MERIKKEIIIRVKNNNILRELIIKPIQNNIIFEINNSDLTTEELQDSISLLNHFIVNFRNGIFDNTEFIVVDNELKITHSLKENPIKLSRTFRIDDLYCNLINKLMLTYVKEYYNEDDDN